MKIKLTEQLFQNVISYWAGKLHLPLPLFRRDNRTKGMAVIYCGDCNFYSISYNFKAIKELEHAEIMGLVYHELGHIKYKTCLWKDKVKSEHVAEKYSLKCLKEHFPDFYEKQVKDWKETVKDKEWRKENPKYAKAFDKIEEYK